MSKSLSVLNFHDQLQKPDDPSSTFNFEEDNVSQTCNGEKKLYLSNDRSCSCTAFTQRGIPCAHIIYYRRITNHPMTADELVKLFPRPCWRTKVCSTMMKKKSIANYLTLVQCSRSQRSQMPAFGTMKIDSLIGSGGFSIWSIGCFESCYICIDGQEGGCARRFTN